MMLSFTGGVLVVHENLYPDRVMIEGLAASRMPAILLRLDPTLDELARYMRSGFFAVDGMEALAQQPSWTGPEEGDPWSRLTRWEVNQAALGTNLAENPWEPWEEHSVILSCASWRGRGTSDPHNAELHRVLAELTFIQGRDADEWTVEVRSCFPTGLPASATLQQIFPTEVDLAGWNLYQERLAWTENGALLIPAGSVSAPLNPWNQAAARALTYSGLLSTMSTFIEAVERADEVERDAMPSRFDREVL